MATHSSVLAWRIPGTGKPGGLPSLGSHRVGHDWSDLAAAAAVEAKDETLSFGKCLGFKVTYSERGKHSSMYFEYFWALLKCQSNVVQLLIYCCLVAKLCPVLLQSCELLCPCQAPLSMGVLRREYWSVLTVHPPVYLPVPGMKPISPAWQADS